MAESTPLAVGTLLKGRYEIVRRIAGGGMAWVYEARERLPDGSARTWAIKELRADGSAGNLAEARHLFEQEANILVHLKHPNLPEVSAFFEEGGRWYLVMEFVPGVSLARRLEEANAPLLPSEVLEWALQICDVLEYLHGQPQPVIFRDLKPSNVMVTPFGLVKLIDFGIARTFKQGQARDTFTMGSENYAAPEQWGQAQTDARADLYALGATMYHLLTNTAPLPAYVPAPQAPARERNPAVPAPLAAVVERAMAPDREKRFQSAAEMSAALWGCLTLWERRQLRARLMALRQERALLHEATPLERGFRSNLPARQGYPSGKVCPFCGVRNREEARYCRSCGTPMDAADSARLILVEPAGISLEFALRDEGAALLGRRGGARPVHLDLSPYDPQGYVSRNHATIASRQGVHHLIDLGGVNGTFVNGQRLTPRTPQRLYHGDRIRLGRVVLEFRQKGR